VYTWGKEDALLAADVDSLCCHFVFGILRVSLGLLLCCYVVSDGKW
jgi:hypothetical protein